jgi:hypothetical protein
MGMGVISSWAKTKPTATVTDENIRRVTMILRKMPEITGRLI